MTPCQSHVREDVAISLDKQAVTLAIVARNVLSHAIRASTIGGSPAPRSNSVVEEVCTHTTPDTEPSKLASMAGTQSMMSRSMTSMRASTSGPSRRPGASLAVHHAPSCFLGRRVASSPDSALGEYGRIAGLLIVRSFYVLA
jgi:hypothetical protein